MIGGAVHEPEHTAIEHGGLDVVPIARVAEQGVEL